MRLDDSTAAAALEQPLDDALGGALLDAGLAIARAAPA